jgi:hypothetical protein
LRIQRLAGEAGVEVVWIPFLLCPICEIVMANFALQYISD